MADARGGCAAFCGSFGAECLGCAEESRGIVLAAMIFTFFIIEMSL